MKKIINIIFLRFGYMPIRHWHVIEKRKNYIYFDGALLTKETGNFRIFYKNNLVVPTEE